VTGAADGRAVAPDVDHDDPGDPASFPDAFDVVEAHLLGARPSLTRVQVAEQAGVPLGTAEELWRLLGFPNQTDDAVAFTPADVQALELTQDLMELGILGPDSRSALVRTWGRSYARLAEWQTSLLADAAIEGPDPRQRLEELAGAVLPRVEALQTYVWRRHLAGAASRLLTTETTGTSVTSQAVCFVDIVGYTSHSRTLTESGLVDLIENFEDAATSIVVDHGGRIIKMIGDEILFTTDHPAAAAEIALAMTQRGADRDDPFPPVRAGIAHGSVVSRLGDVFGPVVNVAARLTSVARPGAVLVDRGAYRALAGLPADGAVDPGDDETEPVDGGGSDGDPGTSSYRFRRMRRVSVKGYPRLQCWVLRRPQA
jgi:adenylate cyclase